LSSSLSQLWQELFSGSISVLTLIKYITDIEEYLNPLCLHC
jgi:hypothetical protein